YRGLVSGGQVVKDRTGVPPDVARS
ncbi:MAG: hypothetical protein QOG46_2506, partial [Pseudonocardiales bacterium]|nr:hypothetical protein [Pseudonocardiales bacterium]